MPPRTHCSIGRVSLWSLPLSRDPSIIVSPEHPTRHRPRWTPRRLHGVGTCPSDPSRPTPVTRSLTSSFPYSTVHGIPSTVLTQTLVDTLWWTSVGPFFRRPWNISYPCLRFLVTEDNNHNGLKYKIRFPNFYRTSLCQGSPNGLTRTTTKGECIYLYCQKIFSYHDTLVLWLYGRGQTDELSTYWDLSWN